MKKITLLLLFTLSSLVFFAQVKKTAEDEIIQTVEVEEEEEVDTDIPYSIIDEAPIYPGCEGSKAKLKKCLQFSIQKHVGRNFNTGLANELGLDAGQKRVYVIFKIDKNGDIVEVRARGPHEKLEMEAIRVVKLLPKMIPGKERDRAVNVKYTLPITLLVEGDKKTQEEIVEVEEIEEDEGKPESAPFASVQNVPIYPGCKGTENELRRCIQKSIQMHINKNFNTGLASELGLSSGNKKVYIVFKIDKNGDVVDLRARGPHKRLEMEAMRVTKLLPKMIPGKEQEKPISVKYTLPITLIIE